ncbi:hypothetical protein TNCV_4485081 [Trichonephila clavipes]|nr:hypothetical protein TNCV_4485081 [Trichonephila clavipes]
MENNSMILTSRRRHFYLVGQSKHKVGACGVNNQASAVLAGNELPFVAFTNLSPPKVPPGLPTSSAGPGLHLLFLFARADSQKYSKVLPYSIPDPWSGYL